MYQLLKDVPDWMMGTMLAGAAWYGVSYTVLAPRAMERDKVQEIVPECALQLDGEQDIYVTDALKRAKEAAQYAREESIRNFRVRQNQLRSSMGEMMAIDQLNQVYDNSGLGDLLDSFGMRPNIPVPDVSDIQREINDISGRIRALNVPEKITIPKAPRLELIKSCACAAGEAIAGKRSAYTISMASFRTVRPEKLITLKSDVTNVLNANTCGPKPWENLS